MKIFAAPLQGYTDNAFIEIHHSVYGAPDAYCMPFSRIEKNQVRRQDVARLHRAVEIMSGAGVEIIPQVIFNSVEEFSTLVDAVKEAGFRRVDLNLGCPFPMQTKRGRGAAAISALDMMEQVAGLVKADSNMAYSVKTRLGLEGSEEWRALLPILNTMPLEYVAVHPRTATQMYDGLLSLDQFEAFAEASANPVLYNGDIKCREDISKIEARYPQLAGVMIGRGLLARPSLAGEWTAGADFSLDDRRELFARFHAAMLEQYQSTLCGDTQILQKIKPLWDYVELDLDRKSLKAIRKATSLAKYAIAVDAAL